MYLQYIYIHLTYIKLYSVSIINTDIPGTPVITRSTSEVVENRILTMTCSARSTTILPNNLPSDLKPIMEYRWQRDNKNLTNDDRHQMSDKTLTIDNIQRQDNKITYRCIAHESGSRLSNYKDITLNVMCKYICILLININKIKSETQNLSFV